MIYYLPVILFISKYSFPLSSPSINLYSDIVESTSVACRVVKIVFIGCSSNNSNLYVGEWGDHGGWNI